MSRTFYVQFSVDSKKKRSVYKICFTFAGHDEQLLYCSCFPERSKTEEKQQTSRSPVHWRWRTMLSKRVNPEALHTSHYLCVFALAPFICTPVTNDRQMDPSNNSSGAGRTPQVTFIIEPHWPVVDPAGVPLKLGWNNKSSPGADLHVLKVQISLRLDKHLSSRVTCERRRRLQQREGVWNVSRHYKYGSNY